MRFSAFRFLFFFFFLLFLFRSPGERSETRERRASRTFVPGYRSAHPGYRLSGLIVMEPVTTAEAI